MKSLLTFALIAMLSACATPVYFGPTKEEILSAYASMKHMSCNELAEQEARYRITRQFEYMGAAQQIIGQNCKKKS